MFFMKAFLKLAGVFFVMVFMAVTVSSCGDDDDEEFTETIVGTWVEKDSKMPFTMILNADHTGTISYDTSSRALLTDHFNWSTSVASNGANLMNVIHTSGDIIIESVVNEYVLAGNELIMIFDYDDQTYRADFSRR